MKFTVITILIIMTVSCSGKKNNTYTISNVNDSLSENLFTNQNNQKVLDRILHPVDSNYLDLFKKGDFELIINRWENADKNNSDFDSIEYKDFRMSIYYLSLLEKTHNADLDIILSNYDTSYYEYEVFIERHVYSKDLYKQIGFYMLEALIVYDFMNYKKHDLFYQDLSFERFNRIKDNSNYRDELFYSIELLFKTNEIKNYKVKDSLKNIYPSWSYIDTVYKYANSPPLPS
jgi:hypothetical protein